MSELKPLSTAEHLALAVLRGDTSAIGPLVDLLAEQYGAGGREIRPLANTQLATVEKDRLRALIFVTKDLEGNVDVNLRAIHNAYAGWLYWGEPLVLQGVDRVEFYELPEWAAKSARNTGTGGLP